MLSLFRRWDSRSTNTSSNTALKTNIEEESSGRSFISSISEDALVVIFDFIFTESCAKYDSEIFPRHPPALSILKLSHVDERFRLISLSYPHLWTHISATERRPEMGLVNACLERSRDLPLTVHLTVYLSSSHDPFSDDVLSATKKCAHRWRSVHVHFLRIHCTPTSSSGMFVDPMRGLKEMRDISAPALNQLRLMNTAWIMDEEHLFLGSWNVPALRSLATVHNFPSELLSFQELTSLDMRFSVRSADFFNFLAFVQASQLPNLTDLGIAFDHHDQVWTRDVLPTFQRTPLPNVARLRISTLISALYDTYRNRLEKNMLRALSFPNVNELNVTFEGETLRGGIPDPLFYLFDAAERIFGRGNDTNGISDGQFPRVSRLQINISASGLNPHELAGGVASLLLPLHIFPSLKELYVRSNMSPDFGTYYFGGRKQPALRYIEFDVACSAGASTEASSPSFESEHWKWLRALADTLFAQGIWHELEESTLVERVFEDNTDGNSIRVWDAKSVLSRDMSSRFGLTRT
ncbi:hypothetical protein SCHPADRAFT_460459 [Schizopora paradoxa]|uniref:F-box domain-containing protein n=1 Tax=Schizopora paradoxa TaxID=27342 RepID=A0A0H2RQG1_9AGAM|nr:hypothetical protein SCHPADRAFT_460459 [Schizopora paradoxa]